MFKGYKRPLVQEDMWDLNKSDSTAYINEHFQSAMKSQLAKARIQFQKRLKKKGNKSRDRAQEEPVENGLREGISQDVLMMVCVQNTHWTLRQQHHLYVTDLLITCEGSDVNTAVFLQDKMGEKESKKKKETEVDYPKSWLVMTIYKTFKGILWESALFKLLQDLFIFISPQLLKWVQFLFLFYKNPFFRLDTTDNILSNHYPETSPQSYTPRIIQLTSMLTVTNDKLLTSIC